MLELIGLPFAECAQAIEGAAIFFDRGWPNSHFTVGMAKKAANGLIPPVYDGPGSEEQYFQTMKIPKLSWHRQDKACPSCELSTKLLEAI